MTDTCDLAGRKYIAVEYLPGQFDQRAASAVDCVRLIDPVGPGATSARRGCSLFDDKATDGELAQIRHYYINAVESREKDLSRAQRHGAGRGEARRRARRLHGR